MKSKLPLILGGLAVLIGLGVVFGMNKGDDAPAPATNNQNVQSGDQADVGGTKTACELLTQDVAVEVFGPNAKKVNPIVPTQASSDDISVTNCIYDNGSTDNSTLVTGSVLVRAAKKQSAYETNRFGFESGNPSGEGVPISGLGDKAVYEPSLGQVYVLIDDGKYWVVAQAGKMDAALSEKLARAVIKNL